MIYDANGNSLLSVYDKEGVELAQAYDKDGNELIIPSSFNIVAMTYNVEWFSGINANTPMQSEIFADYDADIIGFQEFQTKNGSGVPSTANTLLSSKYPYIRVGNYGNKNAFASKYALSNFSTVPHTTQTMEDTYGGQSYSTATVTIHGKEIFLLTAHITTHKYGIATMTEQATEVFNALQGHEYFIMFADLNTTCRATTDEDYTAYFHKFVDAGYHCANCVEKDGVFVAIDTWTGGTGSGTWYPTDHIITSANIDIDFVSVDNRKLAVAAQTGQTIDHIPLIAELTIN